jgi:hypothetical protein
MQTTSNTNISVVNVVQNPLKVIKLSAKINKDNDSLRTQLIKAYLDLSKGNWITSLDTFCFRVYNPVQLETVYEITSPMCTSISFDHDSKTAISDFALLGHIYAVSPKDQFYFGSFERTWFSVDIPSTDLKICCKQMLMTKQPTAEIDLQLTVLFQRQK